MSAATQRLTKSAARRIDVDGLARLARRVPEPLMRTGMASPGGALVVDQIIRLMPTQLRSGQALDAVVRWDIETRPGKVRTWFLVFTGKSCMATRREPEDRPRVTFALSAEQFVRLAMGQEDGMAMFTSGRIRISGDLMFAQQLTTMFQIPSA